MYPSKRIKEMPSSSSHHFLITTDTTTLSNIILLISISLCFFIPSNVAATITTNATETDLLALLSFKSIIGTDPFGALSTWNSSIHHCRWQGVTCGRRHPDRVTSLILDSFQLDGQISPSLANLIFLQHLSLSNNRLYGNIPEELGLLSRLRYLQTLHLEGNSLSGPIPSSLSNLKGLQDLDLSNNYLSGQVPSFDSAMELEFLNISFNDFQGELLKDGVFKNVDAVDVRGNSQLCGGLPDNHLPKCIPDSPTHNHKSESIKIILVCIAGGVLCISFIIYLLASFYSRRGSQKDPQSITAMKREYKKVSYNDLLKATNNFSVENLIGSGSFGVVYKTSMSLGSAETIAIKVLNLKQHGAFRSFLSQCKASRNVRHRNLIKILSVCSSIDHQGNDFKALIFEFMPNGSLETWLHPNAHEGRPPKHLTLLQRMNVAIDIARALDYLHDHKSVLIHCDLKQSNVLLDDDMTAHVDDFGLAQFLARSDTMSGQSITSTSGIKGSIGYIPPEYGMGGWTSTQGDVHSYGILLLEIFTGICPIDERFGDGLSLHKYVMTAYPALVMDIIDTKLFSSVKEMRIQLYQRTLKNAWFRFTAMTGRVTTKAEVYNFGVILMELITGKRALEGNQSGETFHLVTWFRRKYYTSKVEFKSAIDPYIDQEEETLSSVITVTELACYCCARKAHQRPDMGHVVNVLSSKAEAWKRVDEDLEESYGVEFNFTLPQALRQCQELDMCLTSDASQLSGISSGR